MILDEDDALASRSLSEGVDKGVLIMKEEFARGFDIRFAREAYVVIFNERSYFKASTLEQMVGRANRTQGVQQGRVFVTSTVCIDPETTIEYFRKTEKKPGHDIGAEIAGAIVTLWQHWGVED